MAFIRWEPVPMNRLFTSLFDTPTAAAAPARRFAPATDLVESDSHYILRADLPGVAEEDVTVSLDGDVLSISGERKAESESRSGGFHRYERSSGAFRRSVRLPAGVDAEAITATFDRGVLEVTVPKPQSAAPRTIAITSGEPARAIESSSAPAAAPAGTEAAEATESSEPAAA